MGGPLVGDRSNGTLNVVGCTPEIHTSANSEQWAISRKQRWQHTPRQSARGGLRLPVDGSCLSPGKFIYIRSACSPIVPRKHLPLSLLWGCFSILDFHGLYFATGPPDGTNNPNALPKYTIFTPECRIRIQLHCACSQAIGGLHLNWGPIGTPKGS